MHPGSLHVAWKAVGSLCSTCTSRNIMGHVLHNEGESAVLQCVGDEAVHYYVRLYAHLLCWTWTQPSVAHLTFYFWC